MANINPAHIVLTNVRLSYVHLDKPYAHQPGQEPKYSCTVLVPKNNPENKERIDAAIAAATKAAIDRHGRAFPATPKTSVHDGDGTRPSDGQPFGEECKGHWVFTASNKQPVTVVDLNLQPILDATEIYSGMYANVGITFFGYNAPQNKGIGVALDNVQKIADGEPLGGRRASAEDDFAGLTNAQTPQQYGQQVGQPGQLMQQLQYGQPMQQPQQYQPGQLMQQLQYGQPMQQPQQYQPAPQYQQAQPTQQPQQFYSAVDPITGQPLG